MRRGTNYRRISWSGLGRLRSTLIIDGELTSDNKKMAQSTNDFFRTKTQTIAESIPHTDKDPLDYTRDFLKDMNSEAFGHDDISTNALKALKYSLAPSLAHIINLSFRRGKYPKI